MHMVCRNACKNAMNVCTCVFITRLSMLCLNYTHTISFMLLAHMAHVNACMNATNSFMHARHNTETTCPFSNTLRRSTTNARRM